MAVHHIQQHREAQAMSVIDQVLKFFGCAEA